VAAAEHYLRPEAQATSRALPLGAGVSLFAVWALFGVPWITRQSGLAGGYTALTAIGTAALFLLLARRLWIAKTLAHADSPMRLISVYYGGGPAGPVWALLWLSAVIPMLALTMILAGILVESFSHGAITRETGAGLFALLIMFSAAPAGFAAMVRMGRVQGMLFIVGVIAIAALGYSAIGGWDGFQRAMQNLASQESWGTTGGHGGGDFSNALAISGWIRNASGMAKISDGGVIWTGTLVLSANIAIAGFLLILALPWIFAVERPGVLGRRLGMAWAGWMGAAMLVGAVLLGASNLPAGGATKQIIGVNEFSAAFLDDSTPLLLLELAGASAWKLALIGVTALVALHAFANGLALAGVSALNGFWGRPGDGKREGARTLAFNRVSVISLIAASLLIALAEPGDLSHWGSLAISTGAQLSVPLFGIAWFPRLSRAAAIAGPVAGLVAVLATQPLGQPLLGLIGAPWPAWPYTIHPALWGLGVNLGVSILLSVTGGRADERLAREQFHRRYKKIESELAAPDGRAAMTGFFLAGWAFFAIGPGAVVGNDIFSAPGTGNWEFSIPSILVWQVLAWISGLALITYLTERIPPVPQSVASLEDLLREPDKRREP